MNDYGRAATGTVARRAGSGGRLIRAGQRQRAGVMGWRAPDRRAASVQPLALRQALTRARASNAGVVARTTVILISVEHELNNGQPGPIAVIRTLPAPRLHAV
jgi:hypothetical protein